MPSVSAGLQYRPGREIIGLLPDGEDGEGGCVPAPLRRGSGPGGPPWFRHGLHEFLQSSVYVLSELRYQPWGSGRRGRRNATGGDDACPAGKEKKIRLCRLFASRSTVV